MSDMLQAPAADLNQSPSEKALLNYLTTQNEAYGVLQVKVF